MLIPALRPTRSSPPSFGTTPDWKGTPKADAWVECGPFDVIETDDLDLTETRMSPQDWRLSLETIRTAEEPWQDVRPPDELEEEEEGRPIESHVEEQATLAERAS